MFYAPSHVENLRRGKEIVKEGRELISKHYNSEYRIRTFSVRLLEKHADYMELFADALIPKAVGDDKKASDAYAVMRETMGRAELGIQTCYDHGLVFYALNRVFDTKTNLADTIMY